MSTERVVDRRASSSYVVAPAIELEQSNPPVVLIIWTVGWSEERSMIIQIDSGYLGKDMMLWHGISSCYCTGPFRHRITNNFALDSTYLDWIWISGRIVSTSYAVFIGRYSLPSQVMT